MKLSIKNIILHLYQILIQSNLINLFIIFQTSFTCVYFTNVLWPEFSAWDLIAAVFYYQRCYSDIMKIKNDCQDRVSVLNKRTSNFVEKLHNERELILEDVPTAAIKN